MPDYMIRFLANIIPSKRPHGWPASIYKDVLVRADNLDGLRELTNQQYAFFIRNNGMFVHSDPEKVDESKFVPDAQMFVPLHMISRISTKTTKLASSIPDIEGSVKH